MWEEAFYKAGTLLEGMSKILMLSDTAGEQFMQLKLIVGIGECHKNPIVSAFLKEAVTSKQVNREY